MTTVLIETTLYGDCGWTVWECVNGRPYRSYFHQTYSGALKRLSIILELE